MKFYTSDLHFFHKNIIEYENRPFKTVDDMNKFLISRWNNKVKDNDEVYILGDFAFCNGINANVILQQLNGIKYLIRGNHDRFVDNKYFDKTLFNWIENYKTIIDGNNIVVMFHYPIAVWDRQNYGSIHLYGHVHSNIGKHHPSSVDLINAYNVGIDVNDYEPKTLIELIERFGYNANK